MKNYILIGLVSILTVFGVVISTKCVSLERENLKLKQEQSIIIDSIKIENQILEKEIENLAGQLGLYQQKVDSLNTVKQRVVIRYKTEYIVSENITESIQTLKNNIKCER